MFSRYYDEERRFLTEDGKKFAKKYPGAAKLFKEGGDPDAERLLEGVAFLCGRIRQQMDEGLSEISQALLDLIHPHFLRPIPRASVLAFEPIPGKLGSSQVIEKHTEVRSVAKRETVYPFRTCYDVNLHPLTLWALEEGTVDGERQLHMQFRTLSGVKLKNLSISDLPIYISGVDPLNTYYWFCRGVTRVHLLTRDQAAREIPRPEPLGFGPGEDLFLYPSASFFGYRLLQEFFAFPQKFLFVRFKGLETLREAKGDAFDLVLHFDTPRRGISRLSTEDLRLHCTPIVNLFTDDSSSISFDHTRTEYPVQSSRVANSEIVAVDGARGKLAGKLVPKAYRPFFAFNLDTSASGSGCYYQLRRREPLTIRASPGEPAVPEPRSSKIFASFVDLNRTPVASLPTDSVVFSLTCTNGASDQEPRVGDVTESSDNSPGFARFGNIAPVSPLVPAPSAASVHWNLVSHLSLNHMSFEDVEAFRALLRMYNWEHLRSEHLGLPGERCIRAIEELTSCRDELIVTRGLWPDEPKDLRFGTPIGGRSVSITLQENELSEGELFLFGSVLSSFLASYCSLNSFSRLTVKAKTSQKVYSWPAQLGTQPLL